LRALPVKAGVGFEALPRVVRRRCDRLEPLAEAPGVELHDRLAEVLLDREMVVDGRLADADRRREVGVAERGVAPAPHQHGRAIDQG
jgi:hypothetical protein